jgi:U1 small nuclear ribonucleoprotein
MDEYRRRGPSRAAVKQLKESVQNAGHRTGLPPRLLQLFHARNVPQVAPQAKKPPKLPYTGLSAYVGAFANPGDQDYDPPAEKGPSSPRLFRNRELQLQARINAETKLEK